LRRFSVLALLLLGHSPTAGDAPSSRLARTENRRNKRGRIFGTGYLEKVFERSASLAGALDGGLPQYEACVPVGCCLCVLYGL